jgi:hypothetical protein
MGRGDDGMGWEGWGKFCLRYYFESNAPTLARLCNLTDVCNVSPDVDARMACLELIPTLKIIQLEREKQVNA